jgi:hypothetical protein
MHQTTSLYPAARILIENAQDNYGQKIDEAILLLEDANSPVTRQLQVKLYDSIIDKAHIDFGDIPKSAGNIRDYSGYGSMTDTLRTIKNLAVEQGVGPVVKYAYIVLQAISYIADLSTVYQKGFNTKTEYVALEYDTYVYLCVEATSAILYTFVDYIKDPNKQVMSIKINNTKLRADEFYFEQLKKFNNIQATNGTQYRKMMEEICNGGRDNFIGRERIVGIGAIAVIALSIIPITRAVIYQIYRLRGDLSVALSQQAKFLEMNQTCIMNNSNFDKKKRDDIIKKQKALANELQKISDKLKVKSGKSISESKRDIDKDNKELTLDKIRDDISNAPLDII